MKCVIRSSKEMYDIKICPFKNAYIDIVSNHFENKAFWFIDINSFEDFVNMKNEINEELILADDYSNIFNGMFPIIEIYNENRM